MRLGLIGKWRRRIRGFKTEARVLYYAYRDPRMPWYAKLFILLVAGYAFSPIDLVPDFIPVLGYLDDLLIIPLGVTIAMKIIPATVLVEARRKVETRHAQRPVNRWGAAPVVLLWGLLLLFILRLVMK